MTLLAAILLQAADLLTYRPDHEANPLIVAVGPAAAIPAKVALIVAIAIAWTALTVTDKYRRVRDFLVLFGAVAGAFGFGSNYAGGL